ncbi:MAG: VWA domain-containing protein [Anaerolineae bacterium]
MRMFLAFVAGIGLTIAALWPAWWSVDAAPQAQGGDASACQPTDLETGAPLVSRIVSPTHILDCHTAEVSVTVGADCGDIPLHVVIDIDKSGSMVGQPIGHVKAAAQALVEALEMGDHPSVKVGLVSHGDPAEINSQLTDREGQVLAQIRGLQALHTTQDNLSDSIAKSHSMIRTARREADNPVEVMVVLSDGGQTYPPSMGVQAANRPKSDGVLLVAVCVNNATPGGCAAMRQIASSRKYYAEAQGTAGLTRIFTDIAEEVSDIGLQTMNVEETLPPGLGLVAGSVAPEASEIITGATQTTIKWKIEFPGKAERLSYGVEPSAITTYTLATNTTTFLDTQDKIGSLMVPTAVLTVTGPCIEPSSTPMPADTPTPTVPVPATATATDTPATVPTNTPTSTLTPAPAPVFLPLLNLWKCIELDRPTDVVLLIDASTSMDLLTASGRPKIEAAREGASAFVRLMRPVDQTAIIAFNDDVHVMSRLTGDQAVLETAIAAISTAPWTRIDLAIEAALAELTGPRGQPQHLPVIVLMTDGHASHTTPEQVASAGARARAGGVTIYVIGVGTELDVALLTDVAGDAARYFQADDAEALSRIYGEIARKLPCVPPWEVGR